MATISERLKEAMLLRNVKQIDLVNATGIGKSSISTYISGSYEPKQRNIYKLAKELNLNEAWIIGYDVPMERLMIEENDSKNIIASNLKKIRADKMLRYADISALSAVSKEDLQAFEEGTKRPKSADVRNIELALDLEKGVLKGKKPYIPTGPDESIPTKPNEIVVDNKHIILSPEEYKKLNEFLGRDLREKNEKYIALKKETTELLEKTIDLIYKNKISEDKLKKLNENLKQIAENNE